MLPPPPPFLLFQPKERELTEEEKERLRKEAEAAAAAMVAAAAATASVKHSYLESTVGKEKASTDILTPCVVYPVTFPSSPCYCSPLTPPSPRSYSSAHLPLSPSSCGLPSYLPLSTLLPPPPPMVHPNSFHGLSYRQKTHSQRRQSGRGRGRKTLHVF